MSKLSLKFFILNKVSLNGFSSRILQKILQFSINFLSKDSILLKKNVQLWPNKRQSLPTINNSLRIGFVTELLLRILNSETLPTGLLSRKRLEKKVWDCKAKKK